jgi:hypothetical protein
MADDTLARCLSDDRRPVRQVDGASIVHKRNVGRRQPGIHEPRRDASRADWIGPVTGVDIRSIHPLSPARWMAPPRHIGQGSCHHRDCGSGTASTVRTSCAHCRTRFPSQGSPRCSSTMRTVCLAGGCAGHSRHRGGHGPPHQAGLPCRRRYHFRPESRSICQTSMLKQRGHERYMPISRYNTGSC